MCAGWSPPDTAGRALARLVGCCRAAAWWGNGIFSTAGSLVGVEPSYYAFWNSFVLLDSSSTTGGMVLEHFHAARATPALCMSIPLDLQEHRVLTSPLQAVTCFHSMLKITLFMPFVCVCVGTSKGSYGSPCCGVWYLPSVLKACVGTVGYGGTVPVLPCHPCARRFCIPCKPNQACCQPCLSQLRLAFILGDDVCLQCWSPLSSCSSEIFPCLGISSPSLWARGGI